MFVNRRERCWSVSGSFQCEVAVEERPVLAVGVLLALLWAAKGKLSAGRSGESLAQGLWDFFSAVINILGCLFSAEFHRSDRAGLERVHLCSQPKWLVCGREDWEWSSVQKHQGTPGPLLGATPATLAGLSSSDAIVTTSFLRFCHMPGSWCLFSRAFVVIFHPGQYYKHHFC